MTIEYTHYGDSNIREFSYKQICEDKFEWSFDNWKTTHCGDKKTLESVVEVIHHYGSILNVFEEEMIA